MRAGAGSRHGSLRNGWRLSFHCHADNPCRPHWQMGRRESGQVALVCLFPEATVPRGSHSLDGTYFIIRSPGAGMTGVGDLPYVVPIRHAWRDPDLEHHRCTVLCPEWRGSDCMNEAIGIGDCIGHCGRWMIPVVDVVFPSSVVWPIRSTGRPAWNRSRHGQVNTAAHLSTVVSTLITPEGPPKNERSSLDTSTARSVL
jgi:hypothetical protein